MSTDNKIWVSVNTGRGMTICANDPRNAAEEAVQRVREELGHFDGTVDVEPWGKEPLTFFVRAGQLTPGDGK